MKKYTKQLESFKIIILGLVLVFGIGSVLAWTGPTSNPTVGNLPSPLNSGPMGQTKGGGSFTGSSPLLHINGNMSENDLVIWNNGIITGTLKLGQLANNGTKSLCVNNNGVVIVCTTP